MFRYYFIRLVAQTIRILINCFVAVPLLNLLSVNLRCLVDWPLWESFVSLYEVQSTDVASVPSRYQEIIPSLLADPIALMIKYTLLAPLQMDIGNYSPKPICHIPPLQNANFCSFLFSVYFNCIVKVMYNLLYYQVILKLCVTLTDSECDQIIATYAIDETVEFCGFNKLGSVMAFVLNKLDKCKHFRPNPSCSETDGPSTSEAPSNEPSTSAKPQPINLNLLEQQLQKLCLPFLRVAALLRHHLYEQSLPEITLPQLEFVCLVYFLELVTVDISWDSFDAAKALCFVPGNERKLPELWCEQLEALVRDNDMGRLVVTSKAEAVASLITNQHGLWQQPRLLSIPAEYERLFTVSVHQWRNFKQDFFLTHFFFQYYHEKPCENCGNIPKECSICLLCGTIVCLKQRCCMELLPNSSANCFEAVRVCISF